MSGLVACGYFAGFGSLWAQTLDPAEFSDRAQTISGVLAYLRDDWRFPLFDVEDWVEGRTVNVIFTDSLPLYLLPWKLAGASPETAFHYFLPSWTVLSFAAQGGAAALALWLMGARGGLVVLFGSLLIAALPIFSYRFIHVALATHSVIVLALGLALVRMPEEAGATLRRLLAWAALLSAALLTHLYLFMMVVGLYAVALGALLLQSRREPMPLPALVLIVALLATADLLLGIIAVSGHLSSPSVVSMGFGYFSANLATFFMPLDHSLFFADTIDAPLGQYEGFAYLPLGTLAVVLLGGVLAVWRRAAVVGRARLVLADPLGAALVIFASLFLIVFATGGQFYWGETALLTTTLPWPLEPLGAVFRSSGRFIWLVGYGVVLLAILSVATRLCQRHASALLGLAALATMIELAPMRGHAAMEP
ncbi:MAG: hypothetical protein AAGF76_07635, partial [Pseudomonadota bacterium]